MIIRSRFHRLLRSGSAASTGAAPRLRMNKIASDTLDSAVFTSPVPVSIAANPTLRAARYFFDKLSRELGHTSKEDWYKIEDLKAKISAHGGAGMLVGHFSNSPIKALTESYPDHEWQIWRFSRVPRGFWNDRANQRRFFNWIAQQLGFDGEAQKDKWYEVKRDDVMAAGGGYLLKGLNNSSLQQTLASIYPEHEWEQWRFAAVSEHYWSNPANVTAFFDRLGKKLNVKKLEDWYVRGTVNVIVEAGGAGMLTTRFNGSLLKALEAAYPDHKWQAWWFEKSARNIWTL